MDELKYKEMIDKKAEQVKTKEDLDALLKEVIDYKHDYGTICHGIAAAMIATMHYLDRSPNGGITGFQASCIGWTLIKKTMMIGNGPVAIRCFDHMLYPQYAYKFKSITKETWEYLQKTAKANLEKQTGHPDVIAHWRTVARGIVPFGYSIEGSDA